VIFIHGLGDTGAGWESEMMRFNRANPHLKFILPTAYVPLPSSKSIINDFHNYLNAKLIMILFYSPKRPVTISYGQRMPAWYDIKTLSSRDHEDFDGLPESSQRSTTTHSSALAPLLRLALVAHCVCLWSVEKLIKTEIENGIPASRIVVGGFSQGAALSLYTGYGLYTSHTKPSRCALTCPLSLVCRVCVVCVVCGGGAVCVSCVVCSDSGCLSDWEGSSP
jgi:predicted esterase